MPAPVNTVLPVISGTLEVGESLTTTTGSWIHGVDSYAFQWYRVNANTGAIPGATGQTYVITPDDCEHAIYVTVTATNGTGSTTATSATTAIIPEDWFVVEDGTGKSDALSYVTRAEADMYHSHRQNAAWLALTHGQKEAAMVKATGYISQKYRMRFKGDRVRSTQSLDWPRNYVEYTDYAFVRQNGAQVIGGFLFYPSDEVPKEIKDATCELALFAVSGSLFAEQGQSIKREKVDVLEIEYQDFTSAGRKFPSVDGILAPFLKSAMPRAVRA
jgi:hypothetical protein